MKIIPKHLFAHARDGQLAYQKTPPMKSVHTSMHVKTSTMIQMVSYAIKELL
jgi:hypothetical protein